MSAPRRSLGVVWLTGLPGSGKTTIAQRLVDLLTARRIITEQLDGDAIRSVLPTGFSQAEREARVRAVGFLASRLEWHGVTVVVSMVSPFLESRRFARRLCERFIEVHVATSLARCQQRDPKGLYAAARAGTISGLTGFDAPYEAPDAPELTIDTISAGEDVAARRILASLIRLSSERLLESRAWQRA